MAFSAMRRFSGVTETPWLLSCAISDKQRLRIDDDAIADYRQFAAAHDAGGQQRQLVGHVADHQRVAGIVPALESHHDVGLFRQPVDDLALALVAPLGADNHHVRHKNFFSASAFRTLTPGGAGQVHPEIKEAGG